VYWDGICIFLQSAMGIKNGGGRCGMIIADEMGYNVF